MRADLDLRPIGPADTRVLGSVDPLTAADAKRRAHLEDLLEAGLSWAAFEDGAPAGFAMVTRHFYGFPFVDLLVVAQAQRRRGVGSALMDHCAAVHDADRIFTSTNESNGPMRALLAKAGWRPAGVVYYLDPGDPELIFVRLRG